MKKKKQFFVLSALLFLFLINGLPAQDNQKTENIPKSQAELLYTSALRHYVNGLITKLSAGSIGQERFLVQQIRMINAEIMARVKGVQKVRKTYFEQMNQRLAEVKALRRRLAPYHSQQLNGFIDQVENTIRDALAQGEVDFQKQRAIEDAMQLLYVAEEMVKMDPNAKIDQDAEFTHDLQKTRQKLASKSLTQLSYEDYQSKLMKNEKPTIYDLYREWMRAEQVNYEVRWTDVEIIKKKLIKTGTSKERERMFKRELRQAAEAFNYGFYDLAERSFGEILNSYGFIGQLDDCLFYKALSNYMLQRFLAAQTDFERLVHDYPTSSFLPQAYRYLMRIALHFDQYDKVIAYYNDFLKTGVQGSALYDEATFTAGSASLKLGDYDTAIRYLSRLGKKSPLYYQAQYLLSEAYVGVNNYTEAEQTLQSLVLVEKLNPEFHNKVLLKLAMLYYDLGDYTRAINILDLINPSFSQYDRVLLVYGWSYFKNEMEKPARKRNFERPIQYLNLLLDNFYGSDYQLEARTLLAYIHQLQNDADEAIKNYQYVYSSKDAKELSDALNMESQVLGKIINKTKELQTKAFDKDDPEAFYKAYMLQKKLYKPYIRVTYLDLSSGGFGIQREIDQLNNKLRQLERLRQEAKAQERPDLVKRIEKMEYRIYYAINTMNAQRPSSALGVNYFDVHPLARKESVLESRNKEVLKMRQDIEAQRKEIVKRLNELEIQINQARRDKDYKKLVALELSKQHFSDLMKKLDFLETQAYSMDLQKSNINLNKWSDYGVFGLTNVKFNVKEKTVKEIEQMQKRIQDINQFLKLRRQNIEHKIRQINEQIIVMTRKVRQQERLRKREEMNRQFEETYFDTHDTELNYDTGEPAQAPQQQEQNTNNENQDK